MLPIAWLGRLWSLVLHCIDLDLGRAVRASRRGNVETIEAFPPFSKIPGRACAYGGMYLGQKFVMVGILLLEYADVSFAAGDVHAVVG